MTIDFSDWTQAVDVFHQANPLHPTLAAVVGGVVMLAVGIVIVVSTRGDVGFEVWPAIVFAAFFAGAMSYGIAGYYGGNMAVKAGVPRPDSFTMAAEQRFGITDLACANKAGGPLRECSFDDLDSPRYAEWIRDGKAYHGRIVAHGTRVTLAPDAGAEGKGTE